MKKWLFLFIFMSLGSLPAKALDIPTDCSDLEMLNKTWKQKYYHDLKFDTYLFNPPELTCDSHLYQFVKAVWVIENAKAPRVCHYYETMKKVISQVRFMRDPVSSNSNEPENTCAGAEESSSGRIILYPCFFNSPEQQNSKNYISNLIERVAALTHETRHLEKKDSSHVDCNAGRASCDERFTNDLKLANAYSFEVIYLRDIMDNNGFSTKTKSDINNLIQGRLDNNFLNKISLYNFIPEKSVQTLK